MVQSETFQKSNLEGDYEECLVSSYYITVLVDVEFVIVYPHVFR